MADQNTPQFDEERDRSDRTVEVGGERMAQKLRDHRESSPTLTGGDVDADWDDADDVGEEAVAGGNPTPDQSVVEELGEAMGVTFEDNEPLDFTEKLEKRDRDRWELNPSSAEDFDS
jgi:hypothetical protein